MHRKALRGSHTAVSHEARRSLPERRLQTAPRLRGVSQRSGSAGICTDLWRARS